MTFIKDIKRKIRSYTVCVDLRLVFMIAGLAALFCIITAIVNIDGEACEEMDLPKMALSPFWCIFIWAIEMALYGAALGTALSSPSRSGMGKGMVAAISFCGAVLCYSWISLTYSAQSFLLSALISAVIMMMSLFLFSIYKKMNVLSSFIMLFFCGWILYIFYFSAALCFLS